MWIGRRRNDVDPAAFEIRFAALERRLDDLEDLAQAALAPDRIDELAARLDELTASAATRDEVLDLRLRTARIVAQVTDATVELRSALATSRAASD